MKQRIISAIIGILILIVVLIFKDTFVFNLMVGILSALAIGEILHCTRTKHLSIYIPCMVFAFIIPFIITNSKISYISITVFFVILMLMIYLKNYQTIKYSRISIAIASSIMVSFSFSSLVAVKDIGKLYPNTFHKNDGMFFIFLVLICAWITDSGAYFTGVFFGKHKMAPVVSPKKTVEGAIGGILCSILFNILLVFIFNHFIFNDQHISYLLTTIYALVLSIIGMLGDLNASLIKRNFKVKDYGNIMPGHGGIMDRFDSVSFIAPVLYAFLMIYAANV